MPNNNYIIYIYGHPLDKLTNLKLSDTMVTRVTPIFSAPSEKEAINMFIARCKSDIYDASTKIYEDIDVKSFTVYERKSHHKKEFVPQPITTNNQKMDKNI